MTCWAICVNGDGEEIEVDMHCHDYEEFYNVLDTLCYDILEDGSMGEPMPWEDTETFTNNVN